MERLIDIETFLVIKCNDLDLLIQSLNLNLTSNSELYLLTLIVCNIFAYIIIYFFIKIAIKVLKFIFKKRSNLWL